MTGDELARARRALGEQAAELRTARQQAADLSAELEETSRGLIALHAELEDARQAATRLAVIVQWSDDAMLSLSADGTIQAWNPGAERLLGYAAGEITGRPAADLALPGQAAELAGILRRAAAGEQVTGQQTRAVHKDGTTLDVTITCSAIRDPADAVTGYSVVLHDLTARLAAEAELAATRAERALLAERDRMARDLHDRVIQRIFAAGISLQTAVRLARNPRAAERIEGVISDLDTTITELRETIFTLRHGIRPSAGLRDQIIALTEEAAPALGFTPAVSFSGAPDSVPPEVAEHVLAVCREALSNVARHAGATTATVTLGIGGEVALEVTDNGRGLGAPARSSGLRNMRERAEMLGGTFRISGEPGAGTRLQWRVPLSGRVLPAGRGERPPSRSYVPSACGTGFSS